MFLLCFRVDKLLSDYEITLSNAMSAGINIVEQDFKINWDYLQSVFFSTTILTTIGKPTHYVEWSDFDMQSKSFYFYLWFLDMYYGPNKLGKLVSGLKVQSPTVPTTLKL